MIGINIKLCNSVDEAPIYKKEHGFKALTFVEAVLIKDATYQGAMSVDLVFEDVHGQKYVAMTTANIMSAVHFAISGFKQRVSNSEKN